MYESTSGRRDKLEIMLNLLDVSRQPIKKTHLLYNTNMNFNQLKQYLDMLLTMGLIEIVHRPFKGYKITSKGERFVTLLFNDIKVVTTPKPSNVQVLK